MNGFSKRFGVGLLCALLVGGCRTGNPVLGSRQLAAVNRSAAIFGATDPATGLEGHAPPIATFPGKPTTPTQISGSERDGWGLFMRQSNAKTLVKWGLDGAVTGLPVTWSATFSSGFQARAGQRLVVGAIDGIGPVKFAELDFNSGQVLYETTAGGPNSFYGIAVELNNNGVAGVIFSNSEREKIVFDSFYRAPLNPPMPGGASPVWSSEHYEFPYESAGFGQAYLLGGTQGPDGHVWIFFVSDSAAVIGLIRFRIEGERMVLVEFIRKFIDSGQSGISPSGENLNITAVHDRQRGRILLCYQCWPHLPGCGQFSITSQYTITEVMPDRTVRSLGVTPWVSHHTPYPLPAVFGRPDNVYYDLDFLNADDGCGRGWNIGKLEAGQFNTTDNLPAGRLLAFSPDGWVLAMDSTVFPNVSELLRIRFPAVLTIKKVPAGISVDWTPGEASDVLEERADYGSWVPVNTGPPPVVMPVRNGLRMYRVKRVM